ncbi:unnamed protein product [Symbiodinium pilosum]|uniref:Uncharacterized protein n=1 Tax=Symbiodinium pilosum TaxID=2952 RepID=A0A812X7D9_SYMPI|nr:unnamed protein product [Symbiodinium pilosum]
MEPEEPFYGDELTYFASYAQPAYALKLPSMEQLTTWNPSIALASEESKAARNSFQREDTNLFDPQFRQDSAARALDLAGLTTLERYEACMQMLHPDRACDWYSWFRISGVTATMLNRYDHDDLARKRIWNAHCEWSCNYPNFCEQENFEVVLQAQQKVTPGIKILLELLRHDNPNLQVREHAWPFHIPRKAQEMATP